MGLNLLSQKLGLKETLALYGMIARGEGFVEFSYWAVGVLLSTSMLLLHVG